MDSVSGKGAGRGASKSSISCSSLLTGLVDVPGCLRELVFKYKLGEMERQG